MLQPKQIPTTGRNVDFQIKQLGYSSLDDFVTSLPNNAVVADVGAGLSRLGHQVAGVRPDITWINIDPGYNDAGIFDAASSDLPANVTLYNGNIVEGFTLPEALRTKADLVYSYWLLPHLSLEHDAVARKACTHMLELLKPNGTLVVGPVRQWGFGLLSPYRYKGTVAHSNAENTEEIVTDIVNKTKLWWLPRMVQLFSNRYQIHLGAYFVGGKSKTA